MLLGWRVQLAGLAACKQTASVVTTHALRGESCAAHAQHVADAVLRFLVLKWVALSSLCNERSNDQLFGVNLSNIIHLTLDKFMHVTDCRGKWVRSRWRPRPATTRQLRRPSTIKSNSVNIVSLIDHYSRIDRKIRFQSFQLQSQ